MDNTNNFLKSTTSKKEINKFFILLIIVFMLFTLLFIIARPNHPINYYHPIIDKCIPEKTLRPNLFLTYMSKDRVPQKVWHGLSNFARYFNIRFFDDTDCDNYLRTYFEPSVIQRYYLLNSGAHRADLWRYCVLWREGGLYMDIKTHLIRPLEDILPIDHNATVLSLINNTIYQGILYVPRPGNIVLRECIAHILSTKQLQIDVGFMSNISRKWGYRFHSLHV